MSARDLEEEHPEILGESYWKKHMTYQSLRVANDHLEMLDVRGYPDRMDYYTFSSVSTVAQAFRDMMIVGPQIVGCAGAYAYALEALHHVKSPSVAFNYAMMEAAISLKMSRKSCVALETILTRMQREFESAAAHNLPQRETADLLMRLANYYAGLVEKNDRQICSFGQTLIADGDTVLLLGGTGSLSSVGPGTATGSVIGAHLAGKRVSAVATFSYPLKLGICMTAPELKSNAIAYRLVSDAGICYSLASYGISAVFIAANEVAANGDVVAFAGSCSAAMYARQLGIPVYAFVPSCTVNLNIESGSRLPLEEMTRYGVDPRMSGVTAPIFDTTPLESITAFVTSSGIVNTKDRDLCRQKLAQIDSDWRAMVGDTF